MSIIKFRYAFQARAGLLESTYYMLEKVNLLLRDYTIDYEEYYNRRSVWCNSGYQANFLWNIWINAHCNNFTTYGNTNKFLTTTGNHQLYFCSSLTGYSIPGQYVVKNASMSAWMGCSLSWFQSYGEYAYQFVDMRDDVDFASGVVNDWDDIALGVGPDAILNSTWVKELYLLSQDKKSRILIRRALIESWDWNADGIVSWDNEYWYTLQMLKLKGFDAWTDHSFSAMTTSGVYDGTVDTWACDYSQWFICHWTWIGNVYSWYRLPSNQDDGRVNLFDRNITVTDRNLMIYPTKDPEYAWADDMSQINPYFTISIKTKLYSGVWQRKLADSMKNFEFGLQTSFTTKNNYLKK